MSVSESTEERVNLGVPGIRPWGHFAWYLAGGRHSCFQYTHCHGCMGCSDPISLDNPREYRSAMALRAAFEGRADQVWGWFVLGGRLLPT